MPPSRFDGMARRILFADGVIDAPAAPAPIDCVAQRIGEAGAVLPRNQAALLQLSSEQSVAVLVPMPTPAC